MPLYSLLLLLVLVGGAPFWLVRLLTSGRYRAGLRQRLGALPAGFGGATRGRRVVWVHAVSVGEVLAAAALIREIVRLQPGLEVAVSTTTEAGQRLAQQRFPAATVFYLPLDFAVLQRRVLRALRPELLVLMESELWPNLLREARRAGCPVVVANARISDRSFPRYWRLRRLWRPLLAQVALFLAQGDETARRLRAIGVAADRIHVDGNLKYDLLPAAEGEVARRVRRWVGQDAEVVVGGSTLEGEELLVLEAWMTVREQRPGVLLVLAPRHPARFASVEQMLEGRGVAVTRASLLADAPDASDARRDDVLLLDTIGDLAGVYRLATVALVGGGWVGKGGHNPLEPARFGVPVVIGPSYENFREVTGALQTAEAVAVVPVSASDADGAAKLGAALLELLGDHEGRRAIGERGAAVVREQAGAATRMAEHFAGLLEERAR